MVAKRCRLDPLDVSKPYQIAGGEELISDFRRGIWGLVGDLRDPVLNRLDDGPDEVMVFRWDSASELALKLRLSWRSNG